MSEPAPLFLREFHQGLGANFAPLAGAELVGDYGDVAAEYRALHETAGVLDLSFRGRLCLTGADRIRFLHGQVTNDVKKLRAGTGCYSALTTAKGKIQSDLNIFCLPDELLLDFEPGLTARVSERLEKYIVADDVQVVDVAPHYGLLSVQGPQAAAALRAGEIFPRLPAASLAWEQVSLELPGEIYVMNHARLAPEAGVSFASSGGGSQGFDVFVPRAALAAVAARLIAAVKTSGGCACGWTAFELARIEAGVPRFGADMDENQLASECGITARAISYQKGCYIGQEVLNRIHSIGHVNRELRRLELAPELTSPPPAGTKLFHAGKEAGHLTSAAFSPRRNCVVALAYVHRDANASGTTLTLQNESGTTVGVVR